MRIIKNNLEEKEIICPKCKSELAYTEKDIHYQNWEYMGYYFMIDFVSCPICRNQITIKSGYV